MNFLRHFHATVLSGLYRWPREHYRVLAGRTGEPGLVPIAAPRLSYYADPFLWRHADGRLWLFVEEFLYLKCRARLAAVPLDDTFRPAGPAQPIVLPSDHHVSFPLIFGHQGKLFLLPETGAGGTVELYVCDGFPDRWSRAATLLKGIDAVDTLPLHHAGRWWLFTSVRRQRTDGGKRALAIFSAEDLYSDAWQPHPINSRRLYGESEFSWGRGAGSFVRAEDGAWLRPIQASMRYYGEAAAWMRLEVLTLEDFHETLWTGPHPLVTLTQRISPHHISLCDDCVACDVRDRVSWGEHIPLWRRRAVRAEPRAVMAGRLGVAGRDAA